LKQSSLREAGLSRQQAHRCERIAAVPEPVFEEVLAARRARRQPVTVKEWSALVWSSSPSA
jgi:hypothetical protein